MRTDRQRTGAFAERLVADGLVERGWRILGRGLRVGRAEVDILAVDPGPPAALVVVEVRFRGRRDFGHPEETVGHAKRRVLRGAASRLLEAGETPDGTPLPRLALRIDLVAVEPARGGDEVPMTVRHHRGAI